jgi:hypothetical protein
MAAEEILVAAGRVVVPHRLALAVEAIDAVTRAHAVGRIRVLRETIREPAGASKRGFRDHGGSVFVHRHAKGSAIATVRLVDPLREYVPRRMTVLLWPRTVVAQADQDPPTGPFVPAQSRLLRPWLLPGAAYRAPRGTTGMRCRFLVQNVPVRWARVEVFTSSGLIGWGHGDDRGEVLVVATERAAFPPANTVDFPVAIRVHIPGPPVPAPALPHQDPVADLVAEQVVRSSVPPTQNDLDNVQLRGLAVPPEYVTLQPDLVRNLTVGVINQIGDITLTP